MGVNAKEGEKWSRARRAQKSVSDTLCNFVFFCVKILPFLLFLLLVFFFACEVTLYLIEKRFRGGQSEGPASEKDKKARSFKQGFEKCKKNKNAYPSSCSCVFCWRGRPLALPKALIHKIAGNIRNVQKKTRQK